MVVFCRFTSVDNDYPHFNGFLCALVTSLNRNNDLESDIAAFWTKCVYALLKQGFIFMSRESQTKILWKKIDIKKLKKCYLVIFFAPGWYFYGGGERKSCSFIWGVTATCKGMEKK